MASIRDIYGSRFLNAEDIEGETIVGPILECGIENFADAVGGKKQKLVISLAQADKPIVVNATNADRIAAVYGDDWEQWLGKVVCIQSGRTRFAGKMVKCVEITAPKQELLI
jgi:hypothetical protein